MAEHVSAARAMLTTWALYLAMADSIKLTENKTRLCRSDLRVPANLKAVFRDIRNHLAGNATGMTRDEVLAQELINLLFCKIYDELDTAADKHVAFQTGGEDPAQAIKKRIQRLFERVKLKYHGVFARSETIGLDPESVAHVVQQLQEYAVTEAERDAVGDAFEVFLGPALRGAEGQFFTPRNAVKMMVEILDPQPDETIIDPACGSGGFLVTALSHVRSQRDATDRSDRGSPPRSRFCGIDKDAFLAKVARAYMAVIGDPGAEIFCDNTLKPAADWLPATRASIAHNGFDVVLTNPPFGKKIRVRGQALLSQYQLGHRWTRDRTTGRHAKGDQVLGDQVPQLLFLERCVQLLKPGGRLGIVLPESVLGNPSYGNVIAWLLDTVDLFGVVTLPVSLFKTSGKGGTHAKVCVLFARKPATGSHTSTDQGRIFMADAKWCGHDSRGNPTIRHDADGTAKLLDDMPTVAKNYRRLAENPHNDGDHLGFMRQRSAIEGGVLVPKYYDPELAGALAALTDTHDLLLIGQLEQDGMLDLSTGVEVGKMAYGTGPYPFIRTSDIANWELKSDPKHGVSEAIFEANRDKAQVRPGDILMVRDGTYLIGTCAMVTKYDGDALFQSHLYRLRLKRAGTLDRYVFFAALNTAIVRRQIRSKQFTQDIIDTLGGRIREVRVPLPKDPAARRDIARRTRKVIETRARLRREAGEIAASIVGSPGEAGNSSVLL